MNLGSSEGFNEATGIVDQLGGRRMPNTRHQEEIGQGLRKIKNLNWLHRERRIGPDRLKG